MEAGGGGGGLDVGHIFARLDAKLDDSNFKKFDRAVDDSRAKAKSFGSTQSDVAKSTDQLTEAQKRQVAGLRAQGDGWGSVARKTGASGAALRSYKGDLSKVDQALKGHNQTLRTTSRETDKVSKSTRTSGKETSMLESIVSRFDSVLKSHDRTLSDTVREHEKFKQSTRESSRGLTDMEGSISRVNRATSFFSKTLRLLKWPSFIAGAGAALQGINALLAGVVGLTSALAPLSGLLVALPGILGTIGQAAGTGFLALMGVQEGVKALNAAQLKSGKDSETSAKKQRTSAASVVSAQEQVTSAHEGVRSAVESQDDAERTQEQAVRDLNAARNEAVKSLVDQRNAAIDARDAEQGSQLSLRRAVQELNKAEINPKSSLLEIEELELRVTEAKQGVKEARLESVRSSNEAEKAREQGVKKNPGVVEAIRQRDAAHRGVASSKRDVGKAHREVTKAERGSTEAITGGSEALNETATAIQKVHEKFAELGPDQAKFAKFIFALKPDLKDLQDTAAKGFLPGAEKGIKDTIKNMPVVKRVLGDTSSVLGKLSERAGKLFGSKGFGNDLEKVGKGNAQTLGLMGRSAEHLFKALDNVLVVGQPLIKFLGSFTNHLSADLENATKKGRADGGLASFFEETEETVKTLSNTLGNLGGFFGVVLEQAKPLGKEILSVFETSSKGLDEWSHSVSGKNSIGRYFEDAKEPLWEAGRLVHDITTDFFEMGKGKGMESLTDLLHMLRVELLPVFKDVTEETSESFGPHLIEMVSQVLQLFGKLSGGSGPLTLYVEALSGAAKFTNLLLNDIPGLKGIASNLLGIVAVMKTVEGLGKFTGITRGLELAFGKDFASKLKGKLKTSVVSAVKAAFVRGALAGNLIYTWGEGVAKEAAAGIGKQAAKFKAVARKAVIAFIGTFAPELAAEMAASGRVGEVLSNRFPKIAGMFKGAGKLSGKAFGVGVILGFALLGYEMGKWIGEKLPLKTDIAFKEVAERGAEIFVNSLVDSINFLMDKANIASFLGVDAPNIPRVHLERGKHEREQLQAAEEESKEPSQGSKSRAEAERRTPQKTKQRQRRKVNDELQNETTQEKRESFELLEGKAPSPSWYKGLREEANHPNRGKKPEDEAADTRKKVAGEHKKLRQEVETENEKQEKGVLGHYSKTRKGASEETHLMDKAVTSSFVGTKGSAEDSTAAIAATTGTRFEEARTLATKRSLSMAEGVEHNVRQMSKATGEGMDHVQKSTERALRVFGIKDVKLDLRGGGGGKEVDGPPAPQRLAEGGQFTIPGEGLQDTVYLPGLNAMVAPGENIFASNRHQQPLLDAAVDMAYGTPNLDSFFATFNTPHYMARGGRAPGRGARRYAKGGEVVLDAGVQMSEGVEPQIYKDLRALSAELGKVVYVISGYRSPQHSVEVGGFANDPHTRGEAADIGVGSPLLETMFGVSESALKAVGLYRPFYPASAKEANHVQLLAGGSSGSFSGPAGTGRASAAQKIKEPKIPGQKKAGAFGAIAQTAIGRMTSAANKYVGKKTRRGGAGTLGVSVPSGPIEKMAREMVSQVWSPAEFGAFNSIEMAEAGWNPRAENPSSGAAGLAQALPASKYPAGAWPYTGPESAKLQLEWMVEYIKDRYGTPSAAWAHEQTDNWYAGGGRMARGGRASSRTPRMHDGGGRPKVPGENWSNADKAKARKMIYGISAQTGLHYGPSAVNFINDDSGLWTSKGEPGTRSVNFPKAFIGSLLEPGGNKFGDFIKGITVHELAHAAQTDQVLEEPFGREGGADWFARIAASRILTAAGVKGYGGYNGISSYTGDVQEMKPRGRDWAVSGQFQGGDSKHFARGGGFKGNVNHTYPGAVFGPETAKWDGLTKLQPYVAAALAEAAGKYAGTGMPGWTMEQVSLGEGDLKPGSRSTDNGYGWLAVTKPFGDSFGVPQLGGYGEMLNPVKNAYVAARMWGGSSSHFGAGGTWHGSSHVTDQNKHYTGAYDIRNALGGASFKEALTGKRGGEAIGRSVPELKPGLANAAALGPHKRKRRSPVGLAEQSFATRPKGPGGKYSPAALMRMVSETGISLPYGLTKWGNASGGPNWQGLSVATYTKLANAYYQKVAEYRQQLGEERKAVEENFDSTKVQPLLPSVTALAASTMQTALGYHPPISGEVSAYQSGYAALGGMDTRATEQRSGFRSKLLNTYGESYLAPYRRKESIAEYNRENALAEVSNELGSKSYAQAKLKGLRKKLRWMTTPARQVNKKKTKPRTPNPNKKKPKAKRAARGGRLSGVARHFAKGGKATPAKKNAVAAARPAGQSTAKAKQQQVKKSHAEIRHHTEKVAKRGAAKTKRAEERYEEESEGILSPVEREREEIEEREQEREAYETSRREALAPLLNEVAANVQRTALVGAQQASLFGLPSFARGGQIKRPVAPAAAPAAAAGASHVHVPLSVNLSAGLAALNPHVEAIVDGKIKQLGVSAGTARTTVSAPGRRVSYGGK